MNKILPPAGTLVYITPLPPFGNVPFNKPYTIMGSNLIEELEALGGDVLNDIYLSVGLTLEDMQHDIKLQVPIVSLGTNSVSTLNIPLNRFKITNLNGVEYRRFGLGINLGQLPSRTAFSDIGEELLALVKDRLGVTGVFSAAILSGNDKVSIREHDARYALREANMNNVLSMHTQNHILKQKIELLTLENAKLKACLRT